MMKQFFTVVFLNPATERLELCPDKHTTIDEARVCARKQRHPEAIMEWQIDRRPQFSHHPVEVA